MQGDDYVPMDTSPEQQDVKETLNPYKLMGTVYEFIDQEKYDEAVALLVQILHTAPHQSHLVKVAARMAAEILCVRKSQDVNAIQLLCFSRVPPVEWLGTTGVAAKMLKRTWSRVGDVVLDLSSETKGGALLVHSDGWCKACNATHMENGKPCQACAGCGLVHYCCQKHQKDDWPLHKVECISGKFRHQDLWNDTFYYTEQLEKINQVIGEALMSKHRFGKENV